MSTLSLRNLSYRPRTGSVASRNSTAFTPKLSPNKSQSNLSQTPIRPPNFDRQTSLPFPEDSMAFSPYHMIDGSGDLQLAKPQSIMSSQAQAQNESLRNQSASNQSRTKFFIQPGNKKLGTYVESKRFARRKADCSLTRILSYSKNGEFEDENPTMSYNQHVNLQQKKKTINKMIKTVFQKKDPIPVPTKTPTNKLVQTFTHNASAEHLTSYIANNFQAGSPTNVVKLQQFLKAMKLPMTPQAQAFSHIARFSPQETGFPHLGAGGNTSGREYYSPPSYAYGYTSLQESPTNKVVMRNRSGSINRTNGFDKSKTPIQARPGTTQTFIKRPGTSMKPSKTDTNLLKLTVNLNDHERTRLDNYMHMDFNDGLVYTDSVINLDKEKKNDEVKMENLTQVKQYLLEKAREGNHVNKLHQEYKSKIGEKLMNGIGDKSKLLAISTSEPRDQEIPVGMPRTGNFELAHSDEYHLKSNVHKPFIGPNKNLVNPKESRGYLKKMISLHSSQYLSQFPSPQSKMQRKMLKSMKTEDLWNIESKFERFRRIRRSLKEKLLTLSRMKISPEEFLAQKILPTQPYEHEYADDFIKAAKRGDVDQLEAMLKEVKQLIFQFDSSRQTALHWAAKRGHLEVIELLLRYSAEIDALDITFRTPLYYALREGSSEIVRTLLLNKADPWSTRTTNYKTACTDFKCLRYLNRARKLSLILAFYDYRQRGEIWVREAENMLAPVAEALRTEED